MFDRERFLDVLRYAHQLETDFIASLSDEQRAALGTADAWAAKDIMAHLASWKLRLLDKLQAAARGEPHPTEQEPDDTINARIFEAHQAKTWDEVRAFVDEAYRRTTDYVRGAAEHDLTSPNKSVHDDGRVPWIALLNESVSHATAHLWGYYLENGQPEQAIALQQSVVQSLKSFDDPEVTGLGLYNLACVYSLAGRREDAIRTLGESLRLTPRLTEWSKQDPDLDALREDAGYRALYG